MTSSISSSDKVYELFYRSCFYCAAFVILFCVCDCSIFAADESEAAKNLVTSLKQHLKDGSYLSKEIIAPGIGLTSTLVAGATGMTNMGALKGAFASAFGVTALTYAGLSLFGF